MKKNYLLRLLLGLVGLAATCLLAPPVRAQVPAWALAKLNPMAAQGNNPGFIRSIATDNDGNLFVTGPFWGQATFGTTTLTSRGFADGFVAKYAVATDTWVWAVSMGGTGSDDSWSIGWSAGNVYVSGSISNDLADFHGVRFSATSANTSYTTQLGASTGTSSDIFVAKYRDNGATATLNWTQVAGGRSDDQGQSLVVSGNMVYIAGHINNTASDMLQVRLGGSGTTPGTVVQAGAAGNWSADVLLAKYQDMGLSARVLWTQVIGSPAADFPGGLAVSGPNVYVTGSAHTSTDPARALLAGGSGLTPGTLTQNGASATFSDDIFLAAYTDNGTSATARWTQIAGGTDDDGPYALAASGNSVYVTGMLVNNRSNGKQVVFGGSGTVAGTQPQYGTSATFAGDAFVAKYQDNGATGTPQWTHVAGGSGSDVGLALAVVGSSVYVGLKCDNDQANSQAVVLGGSGTAAGTLSRPGAGASTSSDIVVARYQDQGTTATVSWAQAGGGSNIDAPYALALLGNRLYVGGYTALSTAFGPFSFPSPSATIYTSHLLAALDMTGLLATAPAAVAPALTVYPNPASGAAHLSGAPALTAGQVTDALGRAVATFTTDATGAAVLPAGLAPGVYAVRVGAAVGRLAVQ